MFPLITPDGKVIGKATRQFCHGGSMLLHPVVHLHVFNSEGKLYLQRRSMKKDIAPGLWDTSVGGHVDYGESLDEAVRREAKEEIGLNIDKDSPALQFLFQYIWKSEREEELVTAFGITTNDEPTPDLDEVDEGNFFTKQELQEMLGKSRLTAQFEQQELKHLIEIGAL